MESEMWMLKSDSAPAQVFLVSVLFVYHFLTSNNRSINEKKKQFEIVAMRSEMERNGTIKIEKDR